MSIDQLSTLLDEIRGYIDDYKLIKEENATLKEQVENIRAEVETKYSEQINVLELEKQSLTQDKEELVLELAQKDSEINVLNTKVTKLEEQANLNLVKAQEIVNELKEIINA